MPGTPNNTVTLAVPEEEWHTYRRRVGYLEALVMNVAVHVGMDDDWADVERLAVRWGAVRQQPAANVNFPGEPPPNLIPAWVLPLVRLRRRAGGDLAAAWAALPAALPAGVCLPSEREAATVLIQLGLA